MARVHEWQRINGEALRLLKMKDNERIKYIQGLMDSAKNLKEKVILAFFYIYGMRPEELLELRKEDMLVKENEIVLTLPTAKEGSPRVIILGKNVPFMDIVLAFWDACLLADWRLFPENNVPTGFSLALSRLAKRHRERTGQDAYLAPYVFRKFRISWILYNGGSTLDALAWKGGKSAKVLEESYTFLKPVIKFKETLK